jgi:hypothetical protein
MPAMRIVSAILLLLLSAASALGAAPSLEEAAKWVERHNDADSRLGLAEMKRAAGRSSEALTDLQSLADPALRDLLCWRLLSTAAAQPAHFHTAIEALKAGTPSESWLPVYSLCEAANRHDRAALVALAAKLPQLPRRFPEGAAESAHLKLLRELGLSPTAAGSEVILARTYESLYALRDLDRELLREADFLSASGAGADAAILLKCRDQLRVAYQNAAAHVVEQLFIYRLAGKTRERDELLAKLAAVPYIQDPKARGELFARLGEDAAWRLVVQPLLHSELALVLNPLDLSKSSPQAAVELVVESESRTVSGGETRYVGNVHANLGQHSIRADSLTLHSSDDKSGITLVGSGRVRISGIAGITGEIVADRFSFSTDCGAFTLGGEIRIPTRDGLLKLRACVINRAGEILERRSLIDDFRQNVDTDYRLALLPKIATVYKDGELPADVRFMLALLLLRPHLTWHAPYLPPKPEDRGIREREREDIKKTTNTSPWQPAFGGEYWMLPDITDALLDQFRRSLQDNSAKETPNDAARLAKGADREAFFWRIRDQDHADVARAARLLEGITESEVVGKAQRWAEEIRRNNTVLTLDVTGSYGPGKEAPILLDARNADDLTVEIYRIAKAEDLLWVAGRIGNDFIFRDHSLQYQIIKRRDEEKLAKEVEAVFRRKHERPVPLPASLQAQPLCRWSCAVKDLPVFPHRDEERYRSHWHDDEESSYFGDDCSEFRERLQKSYRPRGRLLSSWQCDRIVRVPGKWLEKPGAYVVAVHANGQTAYAPLIVDPLSLSMERCRDGVLAVVNDSEGMAPAVGARIVAQGILKEMATDANGVAFAKVFAAGTRAIIAEKDGRFAIGGFGRVFEGVYRTVEEEARKRILDRADRQLRELKLADAKVYEDRYVVAAYTDRPTYRPGQQVHFRIIARQLAKDDQARAPSLAFRAEDFELQSRLKIPKQESPVAYSFVDATERTIADGHLRLNDFGTAAGSLTLNAEAATGSYTLRVRLGNRDRLVPGVFAVQYYRRPSFELKVSGVPMEPGDFDVLKLELQGDYYFGKPVSGGAVAVKLLGSSKRELLVEVAGTLDGSGKAALQLRIPKALTTGLYHLLAELRDESGRMVQKSLPLELRRKTDPNPTSAFAALPRFLPIGKELQLKIAGAELIARQRRGRGDSIDTTLNQFKARDGVVTLNFDKPGWYHLKAGDESADLFVYGGKEDPWQTSATSSGQAPIEVDEGGFSAHEQRAPRWVNLSRIHSEEFDEAAKLFDHQELFSLFDRYEAKVGETCRLLVYVPFDKARLAFTYEGHSVRDYLVVDVNGSKSHYHLIDLPICPRHLPHFYLGGHIMAGRGGKELAERFQHKLREKRLEKEDEGRDPLWCRIDVADLRPNQGNERLKVELKTDKTVYKPGEKVDVSLRVRDLAGKSTDAEVSLAAIDESLYTFGEDRVSMLASLFTDPHPAELLYRKSWRSAVGRRWQILADDAKSGKLERMQELLKQMRQDQAMMRLEEAAQVVAVDALAPVSASVLEGMLPVGTMPLGRLRTDFREMAAWLPQLRTDAKGEVSASFTLPDSLTSYRLTTVALNRAADIGTTRATIQARLPLNVQVIVPRFAVEKDRFSAYGLIHNTTERELIGEATWDLKGIASDGKKSIATKFTIAAGQIQRVVVELLAAEIGTAEIALRCTAGAHADAEQRTLPIQPLGRPREVILEGTITGTGTVEIPAGFEPREAHIVIARGEVARSFEGLGYLIDYPYGCVEQTMSRFLPAVVIRDAGRRAPIHLASDVAAKLPQIYSQGLARLYKFQHVDGGWGWWERDDSHDGMTTYVIYGLAIAKRSGITVDSEVIARGCAFLKKRLFDGKLSGLVAAKAIYSLALAGTFDAPEAAAIARRTLQRESTNEERALLALACRQLGVREEAERLARSVRDWKPEDAESLALLLQVRLAFAAPLADCRSTAEALVRCRSGDRWATTQATAAALLALAEFTAYVKAEDPSKPIVVKAKGKDVALIRDADDLKKLVQRIEIPGRVFADGNRVIELVSEGNVPLLYTVVVRGTERLDQIEPRGKEIKITRRRETLDGQPLSRPLKVGEVFAVRLALELEQKQEFVLVEDRRPTSCEFADDQTIRKVRGVWAATEFRDDRVCLSFTHLDKGKHEIVYYLRAETPGTTHILPGCIFPMYAEHLRGETGSDQLTITENGQPR